MSAYPAVERNSVLNTRNTSFLNWSSHCDCFTLLRGNLGFIQESCLTEVVIVKNCVLINNGKSFE